MLIKQIGIQIILLLLIPTTLSAHQINQMFKYISQDQLYTSEPSPKMFGNPDNADKAVNWLKSRFHFSFAEYHNPSNQQFGVIRVINDDLVQPNRGFGTHPHANMEIVSYIISGELTHQDSKHNKETLGRGSIQYMSAGEGVYHSEFNLSPKEPCRFLQIWILPREKNTKVNYSSYRGVAGQSENKWFHLISDKKQDIASQGKINQDCNIYVNQFDQTQNFEVLAKRQVYLVCVEGSFILTSFGKEQLIKQHDGVKLFSDFTLKPADKSHVLILEMAQ